MAWDLELCVEFSGRIILWNFELEPDSIVELRHSVLCYRSGRRARNDTRTSLYSIEARRSKRLRLACFHSPVGLETQMRFLFQPLRVPSEAPDI